LIGGGDAFPRRCAAFDRSVRGARVRERADSTFSNLFDHHGGRIRSGAKLSYRLTTNTRLVLRAIDSESLENHGNRKRRRGRRRHVRQPGETRTRGAPQRGNRRARHASSVGATPNDVTSLRAKVTTPVPYVKGRRSHGEYENDVIGPTSDWRLSGSITR
jgi:hypothetical protein